MATYLDNTNWRVLADWRSNLGDYQIDWVLRVRRDNINGGQFHVIYSLGYCFNGRSGHATTSWYMKLASSYVGWDTVPGGSTFQFYETSPHFNPYDPGMRQGTVSYGFQPILTVERDLNQGSTDSISAEVYFPVIYGSVISLGGEISLPTVYASLDVNPIINGTTYNSGKDGFFFMVEKPDGTELGMYKDYYNNTIGSGDLGTWKITTLNVTGYMASGISQVNVSSVGGSYEVKPSWEGIEDYVDLNSQGATTHGTTQILAKYGADLPDITPPTRADIEFLGYYTQQHGQGTRYYDSQGHGVTVWDSLTTSTLYAAWGISDFAQVSQDGSSYALASTYISQGGGSYDLVDATMVSVSQNGGSYTPVV